MSKECFDTLAMQIDEMKTVKEIVIGGIGEPLFSPLFEYALDRLSNYELTLTTNATAMEGIRLESIMKTIKRIVISIDGFNATFQSLRGAALTKIVDNIALLNLKKKEYDVKFPEIVFQMVISTQNKDEMFKLVDLARELDARKVIFSNVLPVSMHGADQILYRMYENESLKNQFQKLGSYGLRKAVEIQLPNYRLKTERKCNFIENNAAVIVSSGDVTPCYRFSHEGSEVVFGRMKKLDRYSFGNIKGSNLSDIWNSRKYTKFRDMVHINQYPSCLDCDLSDGCDLVRDAKADCYGNEPSCGDCLWTRNITICI